MLDEVEQRREENYKRWLEKAKLQAFEFAGEHPFRQGKQRQVVEAIQMAVRNKNANYQFTRRDYKVDEYTGQLVKRATPLVE